MPQNVPHTFKYTSQQIRCFRTLFGCSVRLLKVKLRSADKYQFLSANCPRQKTVKRVARTGPLAGKFCLKNASVILWFLSFCERPAESFRETKKKHFFQSLQ